MARPPRPADSGFTLIEVMVALAVFALAAIVLVSAYINVLNSYRIASQGLEPDRDLSFARAQLMAITDLTTAEAGLEYDTPDNSPADPSRHIKWTADIEPFAGATPTAPTDLFTVTLTVAVTQPGGQTTQTVDSFNLLRPTWSDPTTRSQQLQTNTDAILKLQGKTPGGGT